QPKARLTGCLTTEEFFCQPQLLLQPFEKIGAGKFLGPLRLTLIQLAHGHDKTSMYIDADLHDSALANGGLGRFIGFVSFVHTLVGVPLERCACQFSSCHLPNEVPTKRGPYHSQVHRRIISSLFWVSDSSAQ